MFKGSITAVADLGFSEGGFYYGIAREKFWAHAHFQSFWRETSSSTCWSISFQSRTMLKDAKVNHRTSYLCSPAREEGSISSIISTWCSQKGGSVAPWDPPLDPPLNWFICPQSLILITCASQMSLVHNEKGREGTWPHTWRYFHPH